MEKHRQDSEVKMTIRFEENVSPENAQIRMPMVQLPWQNPFKNNGWEQ